jgi:MoaA/NifB/PqqE/SkfB family radical SAM enzyme
MNYLDIDQIKSIHIEHTSKCNLFCPQCARTHEGGLNPELELDELTVDDYKKLFTPDFAKQLERVWFCGNYGDPIASNTFLDSCEFLKSVGVDYIQVYTNGSLRSPDWWKRLAKTVDWVTFSVDGLKDTNHIYRVNSKWDKIIENAKAFIEAGGHAHWDYLIFDHNVHQVAEAKELAKEIGFKSISFKNTSRFVTTDTFKKHLNKEKTTVKTRKGEYEISSKENKNKTKYEQIVEKFGSFESYVDKTPISCKTKNKGQIYIDFQFNVWPCCWLGGPSRFYGTKNVQKKQLISLIEKYGVGFNSLKQKSLKEVFDHIWYTNELTSSWQNKMNDSNPKLFTCGRTCGDSYEFSSVGNFNEQRFELNG